MIYLIGGPPKCGKTTLAKLIARERGVQWISTDTLQCVAFEFTPRGERAEKFPWSELRKKTKRVNDVLYDNYHWRKIVSLYRTAAKTTFKAMDAFIAGELAEEHDYVLEGHAIEPRFAERLVKKYGDDKVRAVFMVKRDEQAFVENIERSETANDWIIRRTKAPERIYPKIAKMICEYGRIVEREAEKFGFEVVETDEDFVGQLGKAMGVLGFK